MRKVTIWGLVMAVVLALSFVAPLTAEVRTASEHDAQSITLFRGIDLAAPGANAPIITTSLTMNNRNSAVRVTVVLATGSVFNRTLESDLGVAVFPHGLNQSNALNAGDMYEFTFSCPRYGWDQTDNREDTTDELGLNFEVETDGRITFIQVEEIIGEGR